MTIMTTALQLRLMPMMTIHDDCNESNDNSDYDENNDNSDNYKNEYNGNIDNK